MAVFEVPRIMVSLSENEMIALYRFLRAREESLDVRLVPLLTRIEKKLYDKLSIEDLEGLSKSGLKKGSASDEKPMNGGDL